MPVPQGFRSEQRWSRHLISYRLRHFDLSTKEFVILTGFQIDEDLNNSTAWGSTYLLR